MKKINKQHCEFLRNQAKRKFDKVRSTWIDLLKWTIPHRATWLLSQNPGERKNQHIVDPTHILAQRSFVAGFLEGNTSATRPWVRIGSKDGAKDDSFEAKSWLQHFTDRVHNALGTSNFYHAAGSFYYDYSAVNTGAHYMEVLPNGGFFVHTLVPGSYYVINNAYGEASVMVREFCMNVKSIVETYGVRDEKTGKYKWDNFSNTVKKMYDDCNYSHLIDVVHVIMENPDYDYRDPDNVNNRKWLELTYEVGSANGNFQSDDGQDHREGFNALENEVYLKRFTGRRKPFIVGKSTEDFEYGERGPTLEALGLIKSLNKKAIGKDRALEQILSPTLQGPASLKKSYVSNNPNTYIPLDARSMSAKQKVEPIYQISPAIGSLIQDVSDMRQQVDKLYYADFLLYLSKNPKTRTARETDAIVEEQQRIIGPNLQSLNHTYNEPVLEWVMDYVLYEDPYLLPPPPELEGQSLKPEMISVFAQAQRAADLPAIDRYVAMVANVAQIDPRILDKANLDKLADLYEDRLYLPAGLNNPQNKVDAKREQAEREMKRQRALQETLPAVAKAAKDASSIQMPQQG
jgi:hypothetical protein